MRESIYRRARRASALARLATPLGLIVLVTSGGGDCEPEGPTPRPVSFENPYLRITWQVERDSLVAIAIDPLPEQPGGKEARRPRGGATRPETRESVSLPRALRNVAPTSRDRREIDATLLTLHDDRGRLVGTRVQNDHPTVFLDRYDGPGGGPRPYDPPRRTATIRVPPGTRFLALHSLRFFPPGGEPDSTDPAWDGLTRFHVDRGRPGGPPGAPARGGPRGAGVHTLGLVDIRPPGPAGVHGLLPVFNPDPSPFPDELDLSKLGLPDPFDLKAILKRAPIWEWRQLREPTALMGLTLASNGEVLGHEVLWYPTETVYPVEGDTYRVVILGDGFDESDADQDLFVHYSDVFAEAFLAEPPFASVRESIAIARVRVASDESGISYCSATDEEVATYFQVRGCYVEDQPAECNTYPDEVGGGSPTYVGIDESDLWRVTSAAKLAFDGASADLHVMIANCDLRGGRADRRDHVRTAFVTLPPSSVFYYTDEFCNYDSRNIDSAGRDSVFASVALHECAHVMAGLNDEYIGCVASDGTEWPNLATLEEVESGTVPWLTDVAGDPPIHRYDDSWCTAEHNWTHDETAAAWNELGAYWGCAYVTDVAVTLGICGCLNDTPIASHYFRPQAQCKMRSTRWPFCAVCDDTLRRAILYPKPIPGDEDF